MREQPPIRQKRGPGRPPKAERPVTPEVLGQISRLWLVGKPRSEIALEIAVSETTVRHHLEYSIKPAWRSDLGADAKIEEARANYLIQLGFEGYERSLRDRGEQREKWSPDERGEKTANKTRATAHGDGRLVNLVERTIVKAARDGEIAWLQFVLSVMDFKCRLAGLYPPTRHHVQQGSELRVAGLTPAELDSKMLDVLAERLLKQRAAKSAIGGTSPR